MSDEQVFRLIYSSHSRIEPDDRRSALGAIFATARKNNRSRGITGALVVTDGAFAQALEGDEGIVRGLFDTISRDSRHESVTLLKAEPVEGRVFGRWAMAEVAEDGGPDIRLVSNAQKKTIVAAGPDGTITPEQESVLGFMRESLAGGTRV
jgi:Sensors of blue-light using FAD